MAPRAHNTQSTQFDGYLPAVGQQNISIILKSCGSIKYVNNFEMRVHLTFGIRAFDKTDEDGDSLIVDYD